MTFCCKGGNKIPVHDNIAAMGVKVSLGKFYGFANHDSHGNMGDAFFIGKAKCIPDVVTVVNERLCRKIGEAGTEVIFTFCPGVDYDAGASERPCDLDFFTDRVDASEEKGRTMPEVPMMEIPPIMPNLGLNVFCASSLPPGTDIRMETPE